MGLGARFGGVGKEAREVVELRVRWIWDPWRVARESAGDSELAHSVSMATEGGGREGTEGAEGSAAGGELGKAAWSTWRRHRRPGNRDRPPRRQRHSDGGFGRRRRHYCDVRTGRSMGEEGERLTCGGHV